MLTETPCFFFMPRPYAFCTSYMCNIMLGNNLLTVAFIIFIQDTRLYCSPAVTLLIDYIG